LINENERINRIAEENGQHAEHWRNKFQEIERAPQALQEAQNKIQRLTQEIETLNSEIERLNGALADRYKEIEQLRIKQFEMEKEQGVIPELHNRLNIMQQENERLNQNLNEQHRRADDK